LAKDLIPFQVECLDVTRTCVEKLFAVHATFEKNRAKGRTRHYYDLYKLVGLEEVRRFLEGSHYQSVYADVERYSRENWPDSPLPVDRRFAKSSAFYPSSEDLKVLKQHYSAERSLYFVEPPTFDEILGRILRKKAVHLILH
jgi:hypothetical protein